jgi:hypothetical protein
MQTTRYTQFGRWEGHIKVGDRKQAVDAARTYAVRDRSWGWRWTGEPESGVSRQIAEQVFWLWAPIHWKDRCTHYGLFEHADGKRWKQFAHMFPLFPVGNGFDPLGVEGFRNITAGEHRLTFKPGTRFAATSEIDLIEGEQRTTIRLEPLLTFHMRGIGYHHETWGHGYFKGEEAITAEHWKVGDLDPSLPQHQHLQQVVRATIGDEVGHGVLEQAIFGPYQRYGLKEFLDPVSGKG